MEANVMSPATPTSRATPPCCSNAYDSHPKMLHSLLYNFSQHVNGYTTPPMSHHSSMSPGPISPVAIASAAAAAAMAAGTHQQSSSPASSHDSSRHNPIHRPRSGSVVSLGSTGSSIRDSYSPSHESSTSHDSFSRGSPASIGSSPSPSPPAHEGSKLFGLLKGTMSSPYSSFFNSNNSGSTSYSRSRTPTRTPTTPTATVSSPPPPNQQASLKRQSPSGEEDELPIDLSCKRLRSDTPPSAPSTPLSTSDIDASSTGGSILKSILCGGGSLLSSSLSRSHKNNHSSNPSSPAIPARRESTSSISSNSSSTSISRCSSSRSRVALAKKMMQPVRARVSDWMLKVIQFARKQPEFASLPNFQDKVALVEQAWAWILLLFMAETNFEFAVTPIHGEEEDGRWDPECPTMQSVQSIQTFITKCQTLSLDQTEYHLMRMAVLFHTAPSSMSSAADFVDSVNASVRQSLREHIGDAGKPSTRYSSLLLCIHTLYGINCKMVENLFCRHVLQDSDNMKATLKHMLLESYAEDDADSSKH